LAAQVLEPVQVAATASIEVQGCAVRVVGEGKGLVVSFVITPEVTLGCQARAGACGWQAPLRAGCHAAELFGLQLGCLLFGAQLVQELLFFFAELPAFGGGRGQCAGGGQVQELRYGLVAPLSLELRRHLGRDSLLLVELSDVALGAL
jgi:hypothetical protein